MFSASSKENGCVTAAMMESFQVTITLFCSKLFKKADDKCLAISSGAACPWISCPQSIPPLPHTQRKTFFHPSLEMCLSEADFNRAVFKTWLNGQLYHNKAEVATIFNSVKCHKAEEFFIVAFTRLQFFYEHAMCFIRQLKVFRKTEWEWHWALNEK